MQLRNEQLLQQLKNQALAPIYFLYGEEPLLIQETSSAIRVAAEKSGFAERQVFYADTHFNWPSFLACMNNYELFSEKQLLELHLSCIATAAVQALTLYANNPPKNKLLLIIAGKIDRHFQQSAWFKGIDKIGIITPIGSIQSTQLISWITARCHKLNLKIEKMAIEYLMLATEGNLLATAQTIEKLNLYFGTKDQITTEMLSQVLHNNARFDPFKLTDAALAGNAQRCLHILAQLAEQKVEPLLILWALHRDCRQLASFSFELNKGKNLAILFQEQRIWPKRQQLFQQALARHTLTHCYKLLTLISHIDQLIKGIGVGNIWNALQNLSIKIANPNYSL